MDAVSHAESVRDGAQVAPAGGSDVVVVVEGDRLALPLDVLTAVLALALWMACGSVVLAITEGLGAHPTRRLLIGAVLVILCVVALWQRRALCAALWRRPWLVVVIAAGELGLAAIDGLVRGPYVAFSLTAIGIAAVAARSRTVWLCVALLAFGYLGLALVEHPLDALLSDGRLAIALGAAVGYLAAAVPLMLLRGHFTRITRQSHQILADVRQGAPAFTPALGYAITGTPTALPAPRPSLTATERRVVEALAGGLAPKQIAREWGLALSTIRTHIKHAKRKTGARTLPELTAMTARADWAGSGDDS